jgi:dTDP-4-dehydrorhamnose reductase
VRRVAIVGSRGQLGAAVVREFQAQADVVALDRASLDITDGQAVADTFRKLRPDVIVDCAGYNAVDAAEDHPMDAFAGNAFAVRALARVARELNATLVHYSSDFVFDGTVEHAHTEEDKPNPRSVYAMSKMLGEWFAADVPHHYVLRVESLFGEAPGGPPPKGSVAGIVGSLRSGKSANAFSDRTVSPTYVPDAAKATRDIIERGVPHGLYHLVNSGSCTWLEFAQEAARLMGVEPRINAVRVEDVKLKAPRPKYCALSNQKLEATGVSMPTWQDALARYVDARASG